MNLRLKTRRVILGAGVAGALALGAAMSVTAASASGGTILIGSIAGTTGAYGSTGVAMENGAQLAVEDLNAAGGALGKKFTLQKYNDSASATQASQLFQKLVSAGAVAIAGSGDTGPSTAAMADRLQVPDVGAVDDAGITIYPNGPAKPPLPWVWSWGLNTFAFGGIDAAYSLKHCHGLALLHDPASYGDGGEAGIKRVLGKAHQKLAVDDAITEDWSSGATVGLTNEIDKIKASHASCVVVWLTPQDTARFMETIKTTGVKVTILGNDEIDADTTFSGLAGSAGNGAIGAELTSQLHPSAALLSFEKRYKAKFGLAATPFAIANYDAVMLVGKVIKQEKSTSAAKLRAGLNAVKRYKGLQGTVTFSAQNHATVVQSQLTLVKYDATAKAWKPFAW